MEANFKIGYGLRVGELVHISNVSKGLACQCKCANCGNLLVAKKGKIKIHHFAHKANSECNGAAETTLHLLSKKIIGELDTIFIPPYHFSKSKQHRYGVEVSHSEKIANGGEIKIDDVVIEKSLRNFKPDILITSCQKQLIIEIAVTHKVNRAKLRHIRKYDSPAIEISLELLDALLAPEQLKEKLKNDLKSKAWLFHPKQRTAERSFINKYRQIRRTNRIRIKTETISIQQRPYPQKSLSLHGRNEYDIVADEFNRKNGRYPNVNECLSNWPHLFKKN
jgi:Competence protein CoiA-like family